MTSNKTRLVTLVRVHLGQETIVTNPSSNRHEAGCDKYPVCMENMTTSQHNVSRQILTVIIGLAFPQKEALYVCNLA